MKKQQKDTKAVRELKESWAALLATHGTTPGRKITARSVRTPLSSKDRICPVGRLSHL